MFGASTSFEIFNEPMIRGGAAKVRLIKEIADYLRIHYTTVSKVIKEAEEEEDKR